MRGCQSVVNLQMDGETCPSSRHGGWASLAFWVPFWEATSSLALYMVTSLFYGATMQKWGGWALYFDREEIIPSWQRIKLKNQEVVVSGLDPGYWIPQPILNHHLPVSMPTFLRWRTVNAMLNLLLVPKNINLVRQLLSSHYLPEHSLSGMWPGHWHLMTYCFIWSSLINKSPFPWDQEKWMATYFYSAQYQAQSRCVLRWTRGVGCSS